MTLEGWVRPTAGGSTWRTLLLKEQAGQLVYGLYSNEDSARPSGHVFVGGGDRDTRGTAAAWRSIPGRIWPARTTARCCACS